jgi:protein SCO1
VQLGRPVLIPSLLAVLLAWACGCERTPEPLPELVQVPDFSLVSHRGEPFEGSDMDGQVWVVDFIFTSCVTFCPRMTERMRGLRGDLASTGVRFLSISVDPEHDTAEVLTSYARKNDALHDDWVFLTGDTGEVTRTVVRGFRTPMGERVPHGDDGAYDILHAQHFLLVDRNRTVRGYYRTDAENLEQLARDARRVAGDGPTP